MSEQAGLKNSERAWITIAVAQDALAADVECTRTVRAVVSVLTDRERDAKALGWDRAHTVMCKEGSCRTHRNPWVRSRA